jgi:tRNA-specific 2-thiouridylase
LALKEGVRSDGWEFRIRYRQPLQKGFLVREGSFFYIWFEEPQSGIAAGQFAAWYAVNECIGSGVITD